MKHLQQIAQLAEAGQTEINQFLVEVQINLTDHMAGCCPAVGESECCDRCKRSWNLYTKAQEMLDDK